MWCPTLVSFQLSVTFHGFHYATYRTPHCNFFLCCVLLSAGLEGKVMRRRYRIVLISNITYHRMHFNYILRYTDIQQIIWT
jgi:hypothetical protein